MGSGKWIAGIIGLYVILNIIRIQFFDVATKDITEPVYVQAEKIQDKADSRLDEIKPDDWDAKKVKIYVPKQDIRTCMKKYNMNKNNNLVEEINNSVIECTKDHYVEVRNDEVQDFKRNNAI